MKALVVGAGGQVGRELQRTRPEGVDLQAFERSDLDITNAGQVLEIIRSVRPSLILNAAAYTAVDQAESDRDVAFAVNATGAGHLARAAAAVGSRLVHVSTDFVFDGTRGVPYRPDDATHPLSAYGRSKLDGEEEVRNVLGEEAVIVRSSWIYSQFGANFVRTMLRLMGERPKLGVVADQVGTPTWARGLAEALWEIGGRSEIKGTLHWTDAGVASWFDFAIAIQDLALELGLLEAPIPIEPITTEAYPTPAVRPSYSVLDSNALAARLETPRRHWRQSLRDMLQELRKQDDA